MCGIVGIFNRNNKNVDEKVLNLMNDSLQHRGPNGGGIYFPRPNIGFGHRRLSIIDLSMQASQPMIRGEAERYCLTYNGEIYNFIDLKKQLIDKGYTFYSNSDTEVVLNSYIEWREKAFEYFNGMFALAIYDKKEDVLILARDRYGIKPLYYTMSGNTFLFASEQKAFLKYPTFQNNIELESLKEYFLFQNIFTNKTFYKNVYLLEAGTYLSIQHQGSIKKYQYWDFNFNENTNKISEEEYIEQLEYLFRRAVKRQLVSDVPVGTYLSGGMDSGAITAVAAKEIPYIKSFTCGFDLHSASGLERVFDEREKAEYLSYYCKSEHYEVVLKAGDMQRCMQALVWHIEEPRVGQSYPNYYASYLASRFVKVVLSGAGGDELFGGYPWRYYRSINNNSFNEYADKYYTFWQRLIPTDLVDVFFQPIRESVSHIDPKEIFRNVFQNNKMHLSSPEECINHSLYFEAKTFLHGLLVIEDKLSMAHGIETRVPFLDNDLVDFALKIPVSLKLNNLKEVFSINENEHGTKTEKYFKRTRDGKTILRKAVKNIVPQTTIEGIKQGFSAPDASWFKNESIEYVKEIVFNSNSNIYDYLDKKTVQGLVQQHLSGTENRRLLVWSLLYFDQWCKIYL